MARFADDVTVFWKYDSSMLHRLDGRNAWAAALYLALGLGVLLYRGPGWTVIRASMGDVLIVGFLYFATGIIEFGQPRDRVMGVLGLACGLECLQWFELVQPNDPMWMHLTLGSTFDPWDFLAYGFGMAFAYGLDRYLVSGRTS